MKSSVVQQWPLVLASAIALVCMEQAGIAVGWSSPILVQLQAKDSPIPVSEDVGSWIATILPLSSLFFTPLAALCMHYFGRKPSILLTALPFIIHWLIIAFATSAVELIVARAIGGIGLTFAYTVIPVYLGEISPDNIRGGIGICIQTISNLGTLRIYGIGILPDLWLSSLLSALPIILVFIFYKWLPESPYYLLAKDRRDDAVQGLKKLRNRNNVDEEINQIELIVSEKSDKSSFVEIFTEASHRRALMISIGMFTFAQFTGGTAFLYFAHLIFQKAGDVSANMMSLIKATLQVITAIGAAYIVDSVGKRPLLIISCVGSAVFMVCEGIYFYLQENGYNVESIWWLPLAAMILFNMSQVIGLTTISIAFLGELFHLRVKSVAVCVCKTYLAFSIFAVGKLFYWMTDSFGDAVPFFVFAVVGVLGLVFVIFAVPETKGKSLEDIQYYMKHKKFEN